MFLRFLLFVFVALSVSNEPLYGTDKKELLPIEESFANQRITLVGEGASASLFITYTHDKQTINSTIGLRTFLPDKKGKTSHYYFSHARTLLMQRNHLNLQGVCGSGKYLRNAILEDGKRKFYWRKMLMPLAQQNPLVKNIKGFEPFFDQESDNESLNLATLPIQVESIFCDDMSSVNKAALTDYEQLKLVFDQFCKADEDGLVEKHHPAEISLMLPIIKRIETGKGPSLVVAYLYKDKIVKNKIALKALFKKNSNDQCWHYFTYARLLLLQRKEHSYLKEICISGAELGKIIATNNYIQPYWKNMLTSLAQEDASIKGIRGLEAFFPQEKAPTEIGIRVLNAEKKRKRSASPVLYTNVPSDVFDISEFGSGEIGSFNNAFVQEETFQDAFTEIGNTIKKPK